MIRNMAITLKYKRERRAYLEKYAQKVEGGVIDNIYLYISIYTMSLQDGGDHGSPKIFFYYL